MSFLEKAKKVQPPKRMRDKDLTEDHLELVLAYLNGEIDATQTCIAVYGDSKLHMNRVYVLVARVMRKFTEEGAIKIVKK